MYEDKTACVQGQPADRICCRSVFFVTCNRVPDPLRMYPYLVLSSCFKLELDHGIRLAVHHPFPDRAAVGRRESESLSFGISASAFPCVIQIPAVDRTAVYHHGLGILIQPGLYPAFFIVYVAFKDRCILPFLYCLVPVCLKRLLCLRIFGEGELREELTELAKSLNIAQKVEMPGRSTALLEKMNSAAMFVLSSDYEGMPNVLLEAMCMGMPAISTDCPSGGPRELITDGVNGLLVPVGDDIAMAGAMERMADPGFAKQMADAAYGIREKLTSQEVFVSWYRYLFEEEPK